MSLQLRNDCQGALDALGLSMLHVEVRDKTLAVVGECGQTIVVVSGIQCGSKITTKEIALAVGLFDKFLHKNSADLIKYIKAKKASVGMIQPTYAGSDFNSFTNYSGKLNTTNWYLILSYGTVTCKVPDLKTKKVKITPDDLHYSALPPNNLAGIRTTLNMIADEETELVKAFKELNNYFVIMNDLHVLGSKLSSCSI